MPSSIKKEMWMPEDLFSTIKDYAMPRYMKPLHAIIFQDYLDTINNASSKEEPNLIDLIPLHMPTPLMFAHTYPMPLFIR
jgi:hypothetical protein